MSIITCFFLTLATCYVPEVEANLSQGQPREEGPPTVRSRDRRQVLCYTDRRSSPQLVSFVCMSVFITRSSPPT